MAAASLASIMDDQVSLSVSCLDRLYLNGYVPTLQAPGQLVHFCRKHLGKPIASPALFGPLHDRFVGSVQTFAVEHDVPVIHFQRGQRKDTLAAGYRAHSKVTDGVVFIGIAQERATSFKARKVATDAGGVSFDFSRQSVAVNHVYFYGATRKSRSYREEVRNPSEPSCGLAPIQPSDVHQTRTCGRAIDRAKLR